MAGEKPTRPPEILSAEEKNDIVNFVSKLVAVLRKADPGKQEEWQKNAMIWIDSGDFDALRKKVLDLFSIDELRGKEGSFVMRMSDLLKHHVDDKKEAKAKLVAKLIKRALNENDVLFSAEKDKEGVVSGSRERIGKLRIEI